MQKLDKVFAGLIVVAMAVFWFAIAPAGISSKPSEAVPVTIDSTAVKEVEKKVRKRPLTDAEKRRHAARTVDTELVKRLKRRDNDTPADGGAALRADTSKPPADMDDDGTDTMPFDFEQPERSAFN